MTERSSLVLDEPKVRQLLVAHLASEALGVPGRPHGLQHKQIWTLCGAHKLVFKNEFRHDVQLKVSCEQ